MKKFLFLVIFVAAYAVGLSRAADAVGFREVKIGPLLQGAVIADINEQSVQYSESVECRMSDKGKPCMAVGFSFRPPSIALAQGLACSIVIRGNPSDVPSLAQFPGGVVENSVRIPPEAVTEVTVLTARLTRDPGDTGAVFVGFTCATPEGEKASGQVEVKL